MQGKVSSQKSKASDANVGDLKHLVGRTIKCPNGLIMYFVPGFLDIHPIYPNKDMNFDSILVRQMFMLHTSLCEAYPPNCIVGYDTKRLQNGLWIVDALTT